ncbi:hypothetical protein CEXT_195501 [Caerostris extrusa]|uniref:Uncharacterized protein n=1 Tax=Caerostris extrusa TaxID=172846 RepID=A0AAV4U3M7_CAEEX|nr:hypothetical protein CEXT_195501 [Caerostris extrusa]
MCTCMCNSFGLMSQPLKTQKTSSLNTAVIALFSSYVCATEALKVFKAESSRVYRKMKKVVAVLLSNNWKFDHHHSDARLSLSVSVVCSLDGVM